MNRWDRSRGKTRTKIKEKKKKIGIDQGKSISAYSHMFFSFSDKLI